MTNPVSSRGLFFGALGGFIGGVVGYYLTDWLLDWGLYGMMIPGAAVGLGVGWCSGERSAVYGFLAAVAALCLGLFAEWRFFPFIADPGFPFFLRNVHRLTPISQIMILLGAAFAYWFGQGRERFVKRSSASEPANSARS